jgi:hypothetical protein
MRMAVQTCGQIINYTRNQDMIYRPIFIQLIIWIVFQVNLHAQRESDLFVADSAFIYKNFSQGGTTANLWYNHRELDSLKAKKIKLNSMELNTLSEILSNIRNRKLFQQKYGGDLCYLIVYQQGIRKRYVAYISTDYCFLDDLDAMRRWKIKTTDDIEKFHDLINKNWR